MKILGTVILGLLLLPVISFAKEVDVVRVVDGDTVVVNFDGKDEKVRVVGINTPETVDPRRPVECFGKEASKHAKDLLSGATITLEDYEERDKHGRLLAYLKLSDGSDFGAIMISEGYAYAYRTYSHDRMGEYVRLEKIARQNKLGLWAPDACLDSDETKDLLEKERYEFWKNILNIIQKLIEIFF